MMDSLDDDPEVSPQSQVVKLISKEGHEFFVSRSCALASGTIGTILNGAGQWKENSGPIPTITFEEISTPILEKVIQYFYYKQKYDNTTIVAPKFPVEIESLIPLILAANFLDT